MTAHPFAPRTPAGAALLVITTAGALALGCGDGPAEPSGQLPDVQIVSGAGRTDTIGVVLPEPLRVRVIDASGRPAAGRVVHFQVLPTVRDDSTLPMMLAPVIGHEGSDRLRQTVIDTTDARGAATVRVQMGSGAGTAAVAVAVPELGYADTARYTVAPGAAVQVVAAPADSAAYVGRGYTLRGHAADRAGNPRRNDPVEFTLADGPATVDRTSGALTGTAFGRATVRVQSGGLSTTASLSVVPRAWVAAQQHYPGNGGPIGIYLLELDGSGRVPLAAGLDNAFVSGQGFGWSPDGSDLAIARGYAVNLVAPGSAERPLVALPGPVLLGARFSRDGAWIYFARAGAGLFRARRDGSALERLGRGGTEWGEDYRPSPSHDGQAVAYGSYRSPCGVEDCIRVLDVATGADRTYGGRDFLVRGKLAAWSPTEDLIAYASNSTGVALIRSDGTGARPLAPDVRNVGWMDWSVDGRWLLVSPGVGPVLLFDVASGLRLPLPTLGTYGATAWRP